MLETNRQALLFNFGEHQSYFVIPFRYQSPKRPAVKQRASATISLGQPVVVLWLSAERSLESCGCTVLLFQEIFYFEVSGFASLLNLSTLDRESS